VASIGASAKGRGFADNYLQMLLKPSDKTLGTKYPDDCIVPTAMVHLATRTTYAVPPSESTFVSLLYGKVLKINDPPPVGYTMPSLAYTSGSIFYPAPNTMATSFTTFPTDYGAPQATWTSLSAVDRTLAAGIFMEVTALPVSTFMPSGTIYCLQIQDDEIPTFDPAVLLGPVTEAQCIQAVTASKGFSITVNELSKMSGVTLPLLPQGPQSFVFSDTNAKATRGAATRLEYVGGATSLVPPPGAPGGYTVYAGSAVASIPNLIVLGFGLQEGMELRFEYAHHIEYVPRLEAAGLIEPSPCLPSTTTRETISRAVSSVQTAVFGSSSAGSVAPVLGGTSNVARVAGLAVKGALSLIPGGGILGKLASGAISSWGGAPQWLKTAGSLLG
jgi:hypothetical protein